MPLRFSRMEGRTCMAAKLAISMAGLVATTALVATAPSHWSSNAAPVSPLPAGAVPGHTRCQVDDSALETSKLDGGRNNLQANEYNSNAPLTICGNGTPQFEVTTSGINLATDGPPGAYPSLYRGCHWGICTSDSGLPIEVAALERPGTVTTSYATQTVTEGSWNDSYDIFYNASPTGTQGSGSGIEMMIWLAHGGAVRPAGSIVASNVTIGGKAYDVWWDGYTVTYVRVRPAK